MLTTTRIATTGLAFALLSSCGQGATNGNSAQGKSGPGGGAARTPTVGFVVVEPTSAAITTELAGRTAAFENSDVRPQVSGLIRRRLFTEGSLVRAGQPLYQIDPRVYRAAAAQATANLQSAQANAEAARILSERYKPLADAEAISRQDYTNAVASSRQAQASVAQTRAALDSARINVQFTTVPAPISGRIGRSLFTVGALVSATQADPLTRIQRLDPMFVDIQQSSADMLALRRQLGRDGIVAGSATVRLKLEDGGDYGQSGTVEFTEALVDTSTGTVTLRARFPNPQGVLLPGMFVRATFSQATNTRVFLVPQQGLSRDPKGAATVMLVGPGNKAVQRTVRADRTQGTNWVVTDGLKPGDRVITQGLAQLKPGQAIKPVPAGAEQRVQPPTKEQMDQQGQGKQGGSAGAGGR